MGTVTNKDFSKVSFMDVKYTLISYSFRVQFAKIPFSISYVFQQGKISAQWL